MAMMLWSDAGGLTATKAALRSFGKKLHGGRQAPLRHIYASNGGEMLMSPAVCRAGLLPSFEKRLLERTMGEGTLEKLWSIYR